MVDSPIYRVSKIPVVEPDGDGFIISFNSGKRTFRFQLSRHYFFVGIEHFCYAAQATAHAEVIPIKKKRKG